MLVYIGRRIDMAEARNQDWQLRISA